MFEQPINFWSKHVILSNLSHFSGGFGAAVLLQHYLAGNVFLPAIVGWLAIAFTLITHFIAYTSK
jgi:hypothetical protein